jgi:diguanylate cyclase (GGDEF)-like protein
MAGQKPSSSELTAFALDRSVTPLMGVQVAPLASRRILLVEDDPACAAALSEFLRMEGFVVAVAGSAAEALTAARREPPDLFILDVGLPDGDGFRLASQLGLDRRLAAAPVLFASARHDLPAQVRSHRRPASDPPVDFLQKPFRGDELLVRIERALDDASTRGLLRRAACFDDLTGLGNLRLLSERMEVEAARIARYGTALSVVLADLDGLKRINDTHGHVMGSEVLRAVGDAIRAEIRETDVAVRYGGDEFVILLPHTSLDPAVQFAQRLLGHIRRLRRGDVAVSVSVGVGSFEPARDASLHALIERVDAAAYRAKRRGGDCLEVTPPVRTASDS